MPPERRQAKRIPVNAPAILRTSNAQEGHGQVLNLSGAGLLLRSQVSPGLATEVIVSFKLGARQFIAEAEISRTADDKIAIVFQQEPHGLREWIASLEKKESRRAQRVSWNTLIRVRRDSQAEAEVLQPLDLSRGGVGFQSAQEYQLGELVYIALHYDPEQPDAAIESASRIVRIERLPEWSAFQYGAQFAG